MQPAIMAFTWRAASRTSAPAVATCIMVVAAVTRMSKIATTIKSSISVMPRRVVVCMAGMGYRILMSLRWLWMLSFQPVVLVTGAPIF